MSRRDFDDFVAHSRQHFEEGLIRAGFQEDEAGWVGQVAHGVEATEVVITLPDNFPFGRPRVVPRDPESVPWSWHRERDGGLCLVIDDDHDGLWWREAPVFLDHVAAWFSNAGTGWSQDRPDLDLDRYFPESDDKRLYLYGDLREYVDSFVRFVPVPNNVMRLKSRGRRPDRMIKKFQLDQFGYAASLGSMEAPPRNWDDLAKLTSASVNLEKLIKEHAIRVLLLLYHRGTQQGAIALEVWPHSDEGIGVRRLRSASTAQTPTLIRSGPHAAQLADRNVAVVGVGAVGSFIADMLVRAGVGRLTLIDDDIVMPGNLVRHLVGPDAVGLSKVQAVKDYFVTKRGVPPERIDARDNFVLVPIVAYELLGSHDLVINATADYAITALLHAAAEADGRHFVSAALQNDGSTLRIDILPPLAGAEPLPDSSIPGYQSPVENFEAGCGSPVSPTPPFAVIEAAAAAVRHAVGLLIGMPVHPAGEVRHLTTLGERPE